MEREPLLLPGGRQVASAKEAELAEALREAKTCREELKDAVQRESHAYDHLVGELLEQAPEDEVVQNAADRWEDAADDLDDALRSAASTRHRVLWALDGLSRSK